MKPETLAVFLEHAQRELPREACGLIVNVRGKERYFPCRNLAERAMDFIMDPEDYAAAEDAGDVMAVIHSHPNVSPKPSQADLVGCEASGLPWHIVSIPSGLTHSFEPTGYVAPLVGRRYAHGVLDCYAVIRDWYRENRGIALPDFDRTWEWWKNGQDLYMDNFSAAGFVPVEGPLEVGDVFLMMIGAKVANHAGVYEGRSMMLHHAIGRLSCREIYGGYWAKITRLVVRYKGSP